MRDQGRDNGGSQGTVARPRSSFRWRNIKGLLVVIPAATLLISMFEFTPNMGLWLREIGTNLVLCVSITVPALVFVSLAETERIRNPLTRLAATALACTLAGVVGGLAGWGINYLVFSFHVSHPHYFLLVVVVVSNIFGLALIGYQSVNDRLHETVERLARKEVDEQRLLQLKTRAELEALRAKTNPHFLFNTLNSIASLIPDDPVGAEEMVQRLSNLFQYSLRATSREFVTLGEELDFLEAYLEIEKVRLGGRLDYAIVADREARVVPFPGMLLQPLVENSVLHGIAPKTDGGTVSIRCRTENDRCIISIVDGGPGFEAVPVEEGFGIGGVRERLQLLYGEDHSFDLSTDRGVSINMEMPAATGPGRALRAEDDDALQDGPG